MARRRGALLLGALLAALALGLAPAAYADESPTDPVTWGTGPTDNQVGTGRPNFSYEAEPGAAVRDAIDVVNRSDRPLELAIYASDAFTTAAGVLDLLPAGQEPVDVGSWITLDRSELTVPAGGIVTVPFVLTVPATATPGDHTGGIVTSLVTKASAGQVDVDRRIGSRVLVRVAGELRPELSVTDVQTSYEGTLNPLSSGTARVTYTVTNTGNVRLAAATQVTVGGPFGLLGQVAHPPDVPELLPGDSLTLSSQVAGVWPTLRLEGEVRLDPYVVAQELAVDTTAATGAAGTWAIPWGQLAAVVVLAALVWAAVLWSRHRRAAVQAKVDAAVAQALAEAADSPVEDGS